MCLGEQRQDVVILKTAEAVRGSAFLQPYVRPGGEVTSHLPQSGQSVCHRDMCITGAHVFPPFFNSCVGLPHPQCVCTSLLPASSRIFPKTKSSCICKDMSTNFKVGWFL